MTIGLKEKAEKRENLSSEKLWLWSRVSRLCKSRFLLCEKIVNLLKMLLNYPSHCKEPGFLAEFSTSFIFYTSPITNLQQ